ncbi:solute carrier family 22 member 1-like [Pieris napi]|uniref:solute carrier family 22 member 1-like n=1 Tax=Pieris napi TaxID=78633 RepID=UPI001FB957A2|nr:solute carrier family 22 member 1-like [Pieris napi]
MTTMSISGTIHEDVTTEVLGNIGVWQWTVTILSTILAAPTVLNQYEDAFLLQPPNGVVCRSQYNDTLCSYTVNGTEFMCDSWQVRFMWLVWIKKTWLIFCDKDSTIFLILTVICRFGLCLGSIIFGLISDGFGRRIAIMMNIIAELLFRLAITFCDSESWYLLLIFLKSLSTSGIYYLGLVIVCEIASNKWRTILGFMVSFPRLLNSTCMLAIANSAPNLETYNFIAFLVGLLPLILIRWIPESPQWLLYNRRISSAEKILIRAAKKNRVILCNDFKIRPVDHRAYKCLDEEWTCFTILCTHNVRIIFLSCLIFWALYFFLWSPLYMEVYKDPIYAPVKVLPTTAVLGLPYVCLGKKMKLRFWLALNIVILGASTSIFVFKKRLHLNFVILEVISTIGLASGLISHALLLNITPRVLATKCRATLFGCYYSLGHLGTMTAYLVTTQDIRDLTMMIVVVVITLILVFICLILPDVDGRELPDTLKDMDYFSELSKPLRWVAQKTNSPSHEELELRVHSFSMDGNNSDDTNPPQQIGFVRIWHFIYKSCRQCQNNKTN